jgi:hypothetical protein
MFHSDEDTLLIIELLKNSIKKIPSYLFVFVCLFLIILLIVILVILISVVIGLIFNFDFITNNPMYLYILIGCSSLYIIAKYFYSFFLNIAFGIKGFKALRYSKYLFRQQMRIVIMILILSIIPSISIWIIYKYLLYGSIIYYLGNILMMIYSIFIISISINLLRFTQIVETDEKPPNHSLQPTLRAVR